MSASHYTPQPETSSLPIYPGDFGRPLCSIPGCRRAHHARGLCHRHYSRQWARNHGVKPLYVGPLGLTAAEEEIARLLLRGLGNKQIARIRDVTLGSLENQLTALYEKIGALGRWHAMTILREVIDADA